MSKTRKIILIIFVLGVSVFLGEFIYYFFSIRRPGRESIPSPSSKKSSITSFEPKTKNLRLAKGILNCLDKTVRDGRGVYGHGKEESSVVSSSNRTGPVVIWGETKYLEKVEDPSQREILLSDIGLYLDKKKVVIIQPDFFTRRLLYEVFQSSVIYGETRERVKELALEAKPVETNNLGFIKERLAKGERPPEVISLINKFSTEGKNKKGISFTSDFNSRMVAAFAADFLSFYQWNKDINDLKIAQWLFYDAVFDYLTEREKMSETTICLTGIASLDFYRFNEQEAFLSFAKKIFSSEKRINQACWLNNSCSGGVSLMPPVTCAFFAKELGSVEPTNSQYKDYVKKTLDYLIKNNYDSTDGCFFDSNTVNKNKEVIANALLVGLLSKENDE